MLKGVIVKELKDAIDITERKAAPSWNYDRPKCSLSQRRMTNLKRGHKRKERRGAYIAWEDNDMNSSNESDNKEANLCFTANHEDDKDEVCLKARNSNCYLDSGAPST